MLRLSQPNIVRFVLLCFFFFIVLILRLGLTHTLFGPPQDNDEIFFDTIALNLSSGHGFSGELSPEVRAVYASLSPQYLDSMVWAKQLGVDSTTTFRPPLYPFLLSLGYRVLGHSFLLPRILNSLFLATGAALLIMLLAHLGGTFAALFGSLLIAIDPHIFVLSHTGLSEPLGFLLSAVFLCLPFLTSPQSNARAISLGICLSLMVLARPIFLFWTPVAAWLAFVPGESEHQPYRRRLRPALIFFSAVMLTYAPWAIRNCLLLRGVFPFGSQGGIVLGAVYSGPPAQWDGNWTVEIARSFEQSLPEGPPGIERERQTLHISQEIFRKWLRSHYDELPRLWLLRSYSLWWRDAMPYQLLLISLFAASSVILFSEGKTYRILFMLTLFHTLAIALTYNARGEELYGRFLLPLYALFFFFIPLGAASMKRRFHRCCRR
jgi:hypothetical protein